MRYEYVEPFVLAIIKVLDAVIQCDIAKGLASLVRGSDITDDIAIVVKLKGASYGSLVLNMPEKTAMRVSSLMLGENFEALTPVVMDSIAEIANMIAGNAASILNDMGYDFIVFPPQILMRNNMGGRMPDIEAFQVPLFTECGEMTMNVALSTN